VTGWSDERDDQNRQQCLTCGKWQWPFLHSCSGVRPPTERPGSRHPIAMSLHFDDADPVSTCLVPACHWHFHGDSMRDATDAWIVHVAMDHREDWGEF
jgi:hypothetical protein